MAIDEHDPLALATAAHALVDVDVRKAIDQAEQALGLARARRAIEAEVAALHARGYAQCELGDGQAVASLRAAVRIADRNRLHKRAALARRTLAGALVDTGEVNAALREIDAACAALDGLELARSQVFRVGILNVAGRAPASGDADSDRALATLRAARDTLWEARLLRNRGLGLRMRGDAAVAQRELARARELFGRLGAHETARSIDIQLAIVSLLLGNLPECLARLDAIGPAGISPRARAELELLRAQALAAARLTGEALGAITIAEDAWARGRIDEYEGRIEAIRIRLLAGDPRSAQALAARTRRRFAAQRRTVLAARATGLGVAAAIAAGRVSPATVASARRAAATLAAAGWSTEASRIRLSGARAAIELGAAGTARRELAACAPLPRSGPVADRIEAWHVQALIALAEGDPGGAQRAARRGLAVLEGHRVALGAADLRASASSIGAALAALGLRVVLADGRPGQTLAWAEALRASSLRLAPVTPPKDPELRSALNELRQLGAAISQAERTGRSSRGLLARQAQLETRVRRRSRHAPGEQPASRARPGLRALRETLGERALVEYVELDGELTALTLAGGRLRRDPLGAAGAVREQLEWLRFALARLARLPARAPQRAALVAGALESATQLERHLIAPVSEAIGARELVLVPTGALHAVPWAMLPSLRGRPVSIAPSASVWCSLAARRGSRRRRVALVAGPRLRHAGAEVRAVAALHPRATALAGAAATVPAALAALDGAAIAHFACHGRVRADSPLFSSLELADGPLSAYELAQLRRAPELIVLSACELAVSDTRPGDELLGFAAALLDMGTRTVIASVVPVADAGARRVTAILHRELAAGATPASALARAQARLPPRDSSLAGFACLGAG